jgi:hypothetical protein
VQLVLNEILRFALLGVPAVVACSVNQTNRTKLVIDLSTLSAATLVIHLGNRKKALAARIQRPTLSRP